MENTLEWELPMFCPLVPIADISMEETAGGLTNSLKELAMNLEHSSILVMKVPLRREKEKNLANCRSGEYEGLKAKIG